MLTLQALTCFEGNDDRNSGTIWSCATSPWHPLKMVRLKSKLDCVIQFNSRGVCTYWSCEINSNIGELRSLRNIKNASPFRWTMTDYICSSSHFVASLQIESFILYSLCVHGVKTYGIKGKETLTGDWEELNKETYVYVCLQNNFIVYFCMQI